MGMHFRYLSDKDIVFCQTFDKYNIANGYDLLNKLSTWMKDYNCKKCLIDHSKANVVMNTTVSYNRPKDFENIGFDNTASGAIVFKELTEEIYFYEDVCQNRGWNVKVFDSYNKALDWLIKPS